MCQVQKKEIENSNFNELSIKWKTYHLYIGLPMYKSILLRNWRLYSFDKPNLNLSITSLKILIKSFALKNLTIVYLEIIKFSENGKMII